MKYGSLNYPVDLTFDVEAGMVLGYDEQYRPFEVIDAEVVKGDVKAGHYDGDGCVFPEPAHFDWTTTVHVQTASPDTLRMASQAVTEAGQIAQTNRFPFHLFREAGQ